MSWVFLAGVVARSCSQPRVKLAAFLILLCFSISIDISQWDRILISELISTSFFALFIALFLLLIERFESATQQQVRWSLLFLIAFLGVASLYSFARDTNAFFLLQIGAYILIAVVIIGIKIKRIPGEMLFVFLGLTAIVLIQLTSSTVGKRWFGPFTNVFYARLRQPDQGLSWFASEGLPLDGGTEKQLQGFTREEFKLWIEGGQANDFKEWLITAWPNSLPEVSPATAAEILRQADPGWTEHAQPRFVRVPQIDRRHPRLVVSALLRVFPA